ncbi:phenylacetate--CoA ligase [Acetobacterium wieringae]|uniref:Phenylacetate-coenzyme A ligase n=1 Tax=Acetobacterium wieringae TaxID=52694 RepID=A0A1F2PG52_9FIRM|nr:MULTISPECIES: phenylacetate--CoA ligase [Acetobacterium]HAZ05896.1 phenylacetate--CoA ligase [Acetobacterium sp.]MEA4806128.1 phenylacetate--CoA ligase [Acetobacterium wieringae]OFV70045.1 phenylacetate-coenzyme A ligase [Acetobacterium wieringae]OXS24553.1 MAG: phenylacetate--CoA ligase [Acetobacterium sp. MES1]TYC87413.1 phenylacetate--CoA ligase [Acetobacterium wieringae]
MYWNKSYECMPREKLQELQLERLKRMVNRIYHDVPFYRNKFQEKGLMPEDVSSLDDLKKLPFTTKVDLRDNYPYGLFTVPLEQIVRIHASSGTTGKPTVVGYTRNDIAMWSELMARCLVAAGAGPHSVIQNAYGYGLFTGGLGVHYGAERLGASIIPISGGNTAKQIMIMQDFGSTVLTCTPSYAIYLSEVLAESGIDPETLKIKAGIFGAEPWSENIRKDIEKKLKIKAYDIYGLSEIMGPGVAIECECQEGLHVWEDHFIPEIIDPNTLEVLPYGEQGELVITTITKEGIPILRYRTRDITRIIAEPCSCGRTHLRINRLQGRSDDMLIIRGVNVFPTQIESVLLEIGEVEPHYQLVVRRDGSLDTLEVKVELSEALFSDRISNLENLEKRIRDRIQSTIGVSTKVALVEPKSLPRSEGKSQRVVDLRKI